jgi:hypothetical protein
MLFWHKYDIASALKDIMLYIPMPNEWSREDKILFEQAYMYHGKNFNKIRQVLPDKSQANLVNYYYMWKKTRTYVSSIDQQQSNAKNSNTSSSNNVNLDLNGFELNNLNGNSNGFGTSSNNAGSGEHDVSDAGSSENESNDGNFNV